jgi:UDP-N-acetylglucosamine 2-epimerase (non-hydrolysing)
MRIALVAGARPNFVKIAPIQAALRPVEDIETLVVHTGQHYDDPMSAAFFRELSIPEPDHMLGVGSAPHAVQTARIMEAFDRLLDAEPVDVVVVVGDVNSTVACSLTAVKRSIPVAHVEAGLRSFDWSMPEEINRIVTDAVSTLLFTPSRDGDENLKREGKAEDEIFFVGNVMVDTLLKFKDEAEARSGIRDELGLSADEYCVLTLHRPSNVDDHSVFDGILGAVSTIAERIPVVYPMHPRSSKMMEAAGLLERARGISGLRLSGPLGYLDFIGLLSRARFAMTDSGGVQEETTVLGVPCLTLRPNTERPVTICEGTNELVGTDPRAIVESALRIIDAPGKPESRLPELWDGKASERITDILRRKGRE